MYKHAAKLHVYKIVEDYVYPKQSFGYKIELHIMIIPFILRVLE